MHVPVVVVVNSLALTHCQDLLDVGHTFVADFRYRLIRGSLIYARFSAVGMGAGLYVGRFIREYIQYIYHKVNMPSKDGLISHHTCLVYVCALTWETKTLKIMNLASSCRHPQI